MQLNALLPLAFLSSSVLGASIAQRQTISISQGGYNINLTSSTNGTTISGCTSGTSCANSSVALYCPNNGCLSNAQNVWNQIDTCNSSDNTCLCSALSLLPLACLDCSIQLSEGNFTISTLEQECTNGTFTGSTTNSTSAGGQHSAALGLRGDVPWVQVGVVLVGVVAGGLLAV